MKIWDLNDECLGVISPYIKPNQNEPAIQHKWNFKVDEEKLLQDEINEVVGIFEKVGARRIARGSKEDREVDAIKVDDRNDKGNKKGGRKTVMMLAEKREGKDKEKENEKNNDYFNEDNAYGEGYEDYYGEDKEEQIEGMINNEKVQKSGMNQMTLDAIKNMVKVKKNK